MIKKISLLSILVLFSCNNSNDDDTVNTSDQNTQPSIVGTWKKNKEIIISGKDGSTISTQLSDNCEKQSAFVFSQNNMVNEDVFETIAGNCNHTVSSNGTYSYNGTNKKVTITLVNNSADSFDVPVLSATELQMNYGESDYNSDGFADKLIYSFNRQ